VELEKPLQDLVRSVSILAGMQELEVRTIWSLSAVHWTILAVWSVVLQYRSVKGF
jgi:hypothetical protein